MSVLDNALAAAYCVGKGGNVTKRVPVANTNGPVQNWVYLAGSAYFCDFTGKDSTISVLLESLYSTQPSLAAQAHIAKVKAIKPKNPNDNPASVYCSQLEGSDLFGGVNASGGGWVIEGTTKILQACIFPDRSSIDSFGLFYHSDNIIRGIDLETVLRYKPN